MWRVVRVRMWHEPDIVLGRLKSWERAEVGFRIPDASVGQPTLSVYCEPDERVLDAIWRGEP